MKKWIGIFSMLILCSFSIEAFGDVWKTSGITGKGEVKRVAVNKYQVLSGMFSDSDLRKFYIVTAGETLGDNSSCSLQGKFKAAVGNSLVFLEADQSYVSMNSQVLCPMRWNGYGYYYYDNRDNCCLILRVTRK